VNVALVPPPEQPKPKPASEPLSKEHKAEKPPEPKVEKPPETKPPPPEKQPPKPSPIEVLKPVFQFGDKDTGPRKSLDGSSVQDTSPSPAKDDTKPSPAAAKDAENKSVASPATEGPADAAKEAEHPQDMKKQATSTQDLDKQPADKQEAVVQDADKQAAAAPMPLAVPGGDGEIALPASAQAPQPRPTKVPKPSPAKFAAPGRRIAPGPSSRKNMAAARPQGYSDLPGVRRLRSPGATGDAQATTSMAGVPRDQRVAKLCASTLQRQLLDASYSPNLLPLVPLKVGNVLDVPETAFSTQATWYRLSFRCEVDTDATTVLSFAFRAGAPIPPEEWARLGLPIRY
jgi:hypothetical protein